MNHIIWWHIRVFNKKHFSDFNYFELLGQQLFFIPLLLLFFWGGRLILKNLPLYLWNLLRLLANKNFGLLWIYQIMCGSILTVCKCFHISLISWSYHPFVNVALQVKSMLANLINKPPNHAFRLTKETRIPGGWGWGRWGTKGKPLP